MRRELLLPFWKAQDSQRAKIATSLFTSFPGITAAFARTQFAGSRTLPFRVGGDIDAQNVL